MAIAETLATDLFSAPTMIRRAQISPCGLYRYHLTRHWDPDKPALAFVMLNPSTADAEIDDPTIRRCVGFARREGAGGIVVVNLYAYRATNPDALQTTLDPFGPLNGVALSEVLDTAAATGIPVVCAWGVNAGPHYRGLFLLKARGVGAPLVSLGTTKEGHPRHPLYVRADQPLAPYGNI